MVRWFAALSLLSLLGGCKKDKAEEETKDTAVSDSGVTNPLEGHDFGAWLASGALPDGSVALAFYDRTSDAIAFASGTPAADGTVSWSYELVDSYPDANGLNPGDAGKYAAMAVAADGTVWLSYQDVSNHAAKYARRATDGTWTVGLADTGGGARPDAGYWTSIALDSSGNPVIAHYDQGQGALRVAHWNGSAFTGEVVTEGEDLVPTDGSATVAANVGEYAKIAIGADGTEYIAFYDRTYGALRLAVGHAGSYSVSLVDDTGDAGLWPDVSISGSSVSIAYQGENMLKLATSSGSGFSSTVVDRSPYSGSDTELWMDGATTHILYFDGVNNDMKHAASNGSGWDLSTVASDGALGYHNEAIATAGGTFAACYNYTARTLFFTKL